MTPSTPPPDDGDNDDPPNHPTMPPSCKADMVEGLLDTRLVREALTLQHYFDKPEASERTLARLVLISANCLQAHELDDDPNAFVVVGRHSQSQLRVDDANLLSLRHALLIPRRVNERDRVIELIPLSPTNEVVPWPRPLPDAFASRCTAFQLGDSLLVIAAVGGGENGTIRQLARPTAGRGLSRQLEVAPVPEPDPDDDTPRLYSRVTRVHMLVDHDYTSEPDDALLAVEVRSGTSLTLVGIREPWLDRGVILGRAEDKCSHAALARALSSAEVSRCHAYFRREGDFVVFYDTASTGGLTIGEDFVRRVAIPAHRRALDASLPRDVRSTLVNPNRVWISLTDETQISVLAIEAPQP